MITLFDEPFTIEVQPQGGIPFVLFGRKADWYPNGDGNPHPAVVVFDNMQAHSLYFDSVETSEKGHFIGVTAEVGNRVEMRPIQPEDAMMSEDLGRQMSLPVDVITASVTGATNVEPDLSALVNDSGYVNTLVLDTGIGLFARYDHDWQVVADPESFLDNKTTVGVGDLAVLIYDQADDVGEMVYLTNLPVDESEDISWLSAAPPPPGAINEAQNVIAAGQILVERQVILTPIRSKADIPAAIAAAADNPSARWYVERRVEALRAGDEFPLPWRKQQ